MAETVDLLVKGGQASGGPPLGPALGPTGINIQEVVTAINQKTADMAGMDVPVKVHINPEDKSFEISIGTPPTSALVKQELNIEKGSQKPGREYIADMPIDNIIKVARVKVDGLLAEDMAAAVNEIIGTCQAMGLKVEGLVPKEAIAAVKEGKWEDKISGKVQLKEVSAEELAKKDIVEIVQQAVKQVPTSGEYESNKNISSQQIQFIDNRCNQLDIDVVKFINIGENTYNSIAEVTKDNAKKMIKVLNTYQNGNEIPDKVKGYNINWRE